MYFRLENDKNDIRKLHVYDDEPMVHPGALNENQPPYNLVFTEESRGQPALKLLMYSFSFIDDMKMKLQ